MIKSSFGFNKPFDKDHRLFANDLAGGGILDVGGYPVSMARLIAGIDAPDGILEPDQVVGAAHLGSTGVDEWSAAILRFPNGIIAEVACSVSIAQDNVLRIFGTEGQMEIDQFWFAAGKQGGTAVIRVFDASGIRTDVAVDEPRHVYSFEADAAAEAIRAGRQEFAYPGMTAADTLGNLKVMDKWRATIGLEYTLETPAVRIKTLLGETLRLKEVLVPRGRIPGLGKRDLAPRSRHDAVLHVPGSLHRSRRVLRSRWQSDRFRLPVRWRDAGQADRRMGAQPRCAGGCCHHREGERIRRSATPMSSPSS